MLTRSRTLLLILAAVLLVVPLLIVRHGPDNSKPFRVTMTAALLANRLGVGGIWSESVLNRWCSAEAEVMVNGIMADMRSEVEEMRRLNVNDLADVGRSP